MSFIQAEKVSKKVKGILKQALSNNTVVHLIAINLGEVYYIGAMIDDIKRLPTRIQDASVERILEAGHIKAQYPLSYADAFSISLALELQMPVITGDPEFKKVKSLVEIIWLMS